MPKPTSREQAHANWANKNTDSQDAAFGAKKAKQEKAAAKKGKS